MSGSRVQAAPFPFGAVLLILFITLKLCGVIAWSWWWVLSPLWISVALVVVVIIVAIGITAVKS